MHKRSSASVAPLMTSNAAGIHLPHPSWAGLLGEVTCGSELGTGEDCVKCRSPSIVSPPAACFSHASHPSETTTRRRTSRVSPAWIATLFSREHSSSPIIDRRHALPEQRNRPVGKLSHSASTPLTSHIASQRRGFKSALMRRDRRSVLGTVIVFGVAVR